MVMSAEDDQSQPLPSNQGKTGDSDQAELRQAWQSMRADQRAQSLVALHSSYTERFLSDNARIWTTAATMIPLSLGAFVVLASIPHPHPWQIIVLAVAGWILMTVWYIIAENHRAFQDNSMKALDDIEKIWGFSKPRANTNYRLARNGTVRLMRLMLWLAITLAAIAVILKWPGGLLNSLFVDRNPM
jgi:hypothetical protein